MFPTIKRFFCAAGVSFLLAPSLHAATYPLAVSHATLGPSPVTFTLVEADGLNSGGSPGNTTRMVNASQFFSGSGFAAGSGLWQWRDFAGLNLRGGPNPGGVDLLEADPARNAPNLRTTVTGLPLAAYEVWLAYMTRNEGGELPQLLVDIETGAVKSPTTLRQRDQSTVFTGRTADRVWDVSLQPLGRVTGTNLNVLVGISAASTRGDYIGVAYRVAPTNVPVAIVTQPSGRFVMVGSNASFSVGAVGNPAPGYQWFKNGDAVPGATAAALTITNARPSDAGVYCVVLTNGFDGARSASALLTVIDSSDSEDLTPYNVHWLSPSSDFNGSMPLGNGDIGVNLWCEPDNDLIFYVSKTDAWSESGRLLKLGRVRVGITPNPFASGEPFHQQLNLRTGEIVVTAGSGASAVTLRVWVDANHPAICVDGQSSQPSNWRVDFETWRTTDRTLSGGERNSAYGIMDGPNPIVVKPDVIVGGQTNQLLWYHHNTSSIWADTFRIQSLGHLTNSLMDPLLNRTFGGLIRASGLTNQSSTRLVSDGARTNFALTVAALTTVTNDVAAWLSKLDGTVASMDGINRQSRYEKHCGWWNEFWQRHWIKVQDRGAGPGMISGNTSPLRIGADNSGATKFTGRMSRVSVYEGSLSGTEVAMLAGIGRDSQVVANVRLVAAWKLDQMTNAVVPDLARGLHPLKAVGSVVLTNDGGSRALGFTGGYLEAAPSGGLDLTNGLTIECWIAPDSLSAQGGRIIDKGVAGTGLGYVLDTFPGNSLRSITSKGTLKYSANLAPGTWVHVALTVDRETATQSLYVNGVLVQEATYPPDTYSVTRGYLLQRFINAAGGRGNSPIKFNGSIFTVDGNSGGQWDADFRQWGPPYWFQNTRLPYHTMIAAGDLDLMQPFFKMYQDALPVARARVQTYYGHAGAYFPETMYFWGTWNNDNYGWNRAGKTPGRSDNGYIRYHWESGIELVFMMLEYFGSTRDSAFATQSLIPMAVEILDLYDCRFSRDGNGKIRLAPAQALETYQEGTINPMPEIAGLRSVLEGLLELPGAILPAERRSQWLRMLSEMPALPERVVSNQTVLSPAAVLGPKLNIEPAELYAVFPFPHFGVGRSNLDLGLRTYKLRQDVGTAGWTQDPIFAAMLGVTNDAKAQVVSRFAAKNQGSRFPGFYGPNYDWTPDQDHPSVAMIALQKMLMQCVGERILLCPAWPADWDVEFKVHAPKNTVLQGRIRSGKLESLTVTPVSRARDVEVMLADGDRDGDGLPDNWETVYFGGPMNGDPEADPDGDGENNRAEYIAGTSPVDARSNFRLSAAAMARGLPDAVLTWAGSSGRVYDLFSCASLSFPSWQVVQTSIPGSGTVHSITLQTTNPASFYRIAVRNVSGGGN